MDFNLLGRGVILGFAIAAPVGPIGILCIKRTLIQGWQWGLVSGLGAATADAVYGSIAGFGLLFISQFLVAQQFWLRLLGGLFLGYLGIRTLGETFRDEPRSPSHTDHSDSRAQPTPPVIAPPLLTAYGSTLGLTLTNPVTILSFTAIFTGMGLTTAHWTGASLLISGIFLGSASWWLLLCGLTHHLNQRIGDRQLRWVSGLSAGIILTFAIAAIISLGQ